MTPHVNPLAGEIEAFVFDVFGTVVDWLGPVSREIHRRATNHQVEMSEGQASDFAKQWRDGYKKETFRRSAPDAEGPWNVDILNRQILDSILNEERWKLLAEVWDPEERAELNLIWHRLEGWPDSSKGLYALKKKHIISTCSHGSVRLLVDMAKHTDLPWDFVFSSELVSSYKPNPKVYSGLAQYLQLPPHKVAMVAAHVHDLRGAAKVGLRTVYVRRETEDAGVGIEQTAGYKAEEFDIVVNSLTELANMFA
ncbi:HAD-like protein [Stereum hirsutum FP-91666 SS1]|uniref:HAD-like protein n=1 Tax=Stereum hirsutum (strain FP-91666) TaxID=721885 RepID=UPI000440FC99|nr:HAD-like protein [Stereum hirsutum FP-91666 SS1]EIM86749.1 HAD-like protein [Stereum hirsutum FP-91666 SS1]